MSLQPHPIGPVPDETQRVARAAFPKGNIFMQMRDVLGPIYDDASFRPLFATRGRPAEAPWRLALVTLMQFAEGLSDRQAAEAVRARIDWKYALGLELSDPGFDFSVLSAFRTRLVAGAAEHLLFDALLTACQERGYLKARGRQRTDATHVLGALRVLSRLERVAETLRAALNAVARVAPAWLQAQAAPDWFERYGRRSEESRLPKGQAARQAYAALVGADGLTFLAAVYGATAPAAVRDLPEVELLRRTWIQQYVVINDQVRWREPTEMPRATDLVESPYEPEAHFGRKRGHSWVGYKVHLTETCDDERPHLLTQVATTVAPATDLGHLAAIQAELARIGLLPAEQLVDAGYVCGSTLVASQRDHQIDLLGPVTDDHQWQAQAKQGFDGAHFQVDWVAQTVTCPRGRQSRRWRTARTARERTMVFVQFAAADCTPCPLRAQCTRAKTLPRSLTLQAQADHEAIQAARQRQQTTAFAERYACRAGIEGTISQGVRAFGLRQARYRGLQKTHLQHVATAAALNVRRVVDWVNDVPRAATRCSPFAALAAA
jgi:transposase